MLSEASEKKLTSTADSTSNELNIINLEDIFAPLLISNVNTSERTFMRFYTDYHHTLHADRSKYFQKFLKNQYLIGCEVCEVCEM